MHEHDPEPDRRRQIDDLITELRRHGIEDERVLRAIRRVPRDRFVPAESRDDAWKNIALPIAAGQTISQPYIVALMSQALELHGLERVLEIGTGSGYQTAVLAELAASVVSIERQPALAATAAALLDRLGYHDATIHTGDGTRGWPDDAPYERIIVTAAAPTIPAALQSQLHPDGGRLVIPVGTAREQELLVQTRSGKQLQTERLGPVSFVPLIGRSGWAARFQPDGHQG